jgi:hypothetical protein
MNYIKKSIKILTILALSFQCSFLLSADKPHSNNKKSIFSALQYKPFDTKAALNDLKNSKQKHCKLPSVVNNRINDNISFFNDVNNVLKYTRQVTQMECIQKMYTEFITPENKTIFNQISNIW